MGMDTTPSGAAHLRRAGRAGGAVRKEAGVSAVGDSLAVCRCIRSSRYVSMTATVAPVRPPTETSGHLMPVLLDTLRSTVAELRAADKQIEHLPAVVLCATLVLPCLTLCPREIRPRRTRPPWRGWMQSKPGERSRPGCASCRSFQRAPRRQFVF